MTNAQKQGICGYRLFEENRGKGVAFTIATAPPEKDLWKIRFIHLDTN
jgi:hypothetical protein